jgi:hypothetical protein
VQHGRTSISGLIALQRGAFFFVYDPIRRSTVTDGFNIAGANKTAAVSSDSKTFYVIKSSNYSSRYLGNIGGKRDEIEVTFSATLAEAVRFNAVNEALTFITQATWASNKKSTARGVTLTFLSNDLHIVKVAEGPSTESRRVLTPSSSLSIGERERFAIYGTLGKTWMKDRASGFAHFEESLNTALLFSSQQNAISFIVTATLEGCGFGPIIIERVAISTKPATFTETVLA